ncbi:MAG: membrane protein insertase YidC [Planctomycetes bacterium]|nr:membrane protein insertase YidC [Planctomycetota bacterium]
MQPQPQSDRRPATAFVVFLICMAAYFSLRNCQKGLNPPPADPTTPAGPSAPDGATGASTDVEAPPSVPATSGVELDENIVVDTATYRARFSNRGAVLVELLLKKFFRESGDEADAAKRDDPAHWLPVIAPHDPTAATFRLKHNSRANGAATLPLEQINWKFDRSNIDGGERLVFQIDDGAGHHFEKHFRFARDGYFFDVELQFSGTTADAAQGTSSYGLVAAGGIWDERNSPFAKAPAAAITSDDVDELQLIDAAALDDGPESRGFLREELRPFFGVRSNFFGFVMAPDVATIGYIDSVTCTRLPDPFRFDHERAKLLSGRAELSGEETAKLREQSLTNVRAEPYLKVAFPSAGAAPLALRFTAFAGPRTSEAMAGPDGESFHVLYEIEYGGTTFRWVNRLLLGWMKILAGLTGNWGVAIILLTLTVKTLLFPLNRLQSRTMEQFQKKMKLLQPKIDELKKQHKNNQQKQNAAQQALMREHKVRPPIFGCLILFLQMPVWYGLFQIMSSAPALRHAPFIGWIHDLSAPDVVPLPFQLPFIGELHLLPILMVVAWLVQNRMMPKATDPQQAQMQKMMNLFPFIFGFMLYKYAAGQSLYMVVNSLLGMLQMKFLRVTPTN